MRALFCLVAAFAGSARAGQVTTVSSGVLRVDNVTRAERGTDEESETFWTVGANRGWDGRWSRDVTWSAGAGVGADVAFEYSDLGSAHAGADVSVARKFGLGPMAPRVVAALGAQHAWFGDGDRDAWRVRPAITAWKRIAQEVELEAGWRHDRDEAATDLFDVAGNEALVRAHWAGGERWSLLAGYRYRDGDIVSYATPPRVDLKAVADVIVPGTRTFDRELTAYRFAARTHVAEAAIACALADPWVLELRFEWQRTERGGLSYDAALAGVGLRGGF